jgi:AmmeMemoRadiSam system protein B
MDALPKARMDLQLIPAQLEGRKVLAVKDLLGLRDEIAVLTPEVLRLLILFDGEHILQDLQRAMMEIGGLQRVAQEDAELLVQQFDELLLLQTPRYLEGKQKAREAFAALPHRPPAFAGTSYPDDPADAATMLDDILRTDEAPPTAVDGIPPASSDHRSAGGARTGIRVLVAPHIEIRHGTRAYARAYASLRHATPSRILLLGTGHILDDGLFSVTTKRYETPLGSFPTDREAVQLLIDAGGKTVAPDDFAHRREHSIEYQVLFLRRVLGGDPPLVPVLLGSMRKQLMQVQRPREIPGVAQFLDALAALVDEKTLVVASVDLSHVGPKFGHDQPAAAQEASFRDHDRALLEALCRGSVTDLWAEARRAGDRFHVCGLPAMACVLELLPEIEGRLLHYEVWHEEPTRSAVSFAAVALTSGSGS